MVIPKFKVPNFDKYKGTTCPKNHLKMYYRKMGAYTKDEELLIHSFQESLTGVAVTWYTNLEPYRVHSWKDLVVAFVRQCQYNVFGYDATTEHVQKGGTDLSKNTPKGGGIWQVK